MSTQIPRKGVFLRNRATFELPKKHTAHWPATDESLSEMKKHLQTAVLIELSTIPLYLYAAYSIKGDPEAVYKLIGIVKQEMLHLGLAGNILNSIGGIPQLYGKGYTPSFPATIFFDDELTLHMQAANKVNVQAFVELEAPVDPKPPQPDEMEALGNLLPDYDSIGDFYNGMRHGMKVLCHEFEKEGKALFQPETFSRQLQAADGSWYDDDMKVIWNLETADKAMEIIIEQGEGSTGKADGVYLSHYQIFKDLRDNHRLRTYPVPVDPKTEDYKDYDIYAPMVACDAAYCYLLVILEDLWVYDHMDRGRLITNNLMVIMLDIIRPLAQFLVQQPNPREPGRTACAPFNFYQFVDGYTAKEQLLTLMQLAVSKYPKLEPVMASTESLFDFEI